jgi:hypothetical protein
MKTFLAEYLSRQVTKLVGQQTRKQVLRNWLSAHRLIPHPVQVSASSLHVHSKVHPVH